MFHAPDLSRRHAAFDPVEAIGSTLAALLLVLGGAVGTGWASVLCAFLVRQ